MHSSMHEVRMNIVTRTSQLFQNWDETELTVNSMSEFKFMNVEGQPSLICLLNFGSNAAKLIDKLHASRCRSAERAIR